MTKSKTSEINRKTIPFGPNERELFDYAENQCRIEGIKFATYVKKLIRQAKDHPISVTADLEKVLDDYFKHKNINIEEKEKALDSVKFNTSDKSALLNFMKK